VKPRKHPSPSAYNYGCHCDECKKVHRVRHAATRAALALRPRSEVPHGAFGYTNWGCRCLVCTQANKDRCAAWRARRKAAKGAPA
jgi:hypothetical protein